MQWEKYLGMPHAIAEVGRNTRSVVLQKTMNNVVRGIGAYPMV